MGDATGWNEMLHYFVVRKGERALVSTFNIAGRDRAGWGKQLATRALGRL